MSTLQITQRVAICLSSQITRGSGSFAGVQSSSDPRLILRVSPVVHRPRRIIYSARLVCKQSRTRMPTNNAIYDTLLRFPHLHTTRLAKDEKKRKKERERTEGKIKKNRAGRERRKSTCARAVRTRCAREQCALLSPILSCNTSTRARRGE